MPDVNYISPSCCLTKECYQLAIVAPGDSGLVASTRRATDSIGDLGRSTSDSTADLERTLRDLDEAAKAIRQLAESIDRDPDMLVKGRAKGNKL